MPKEKKQPRRTDNGVYFEGMYDISCEERVIDEQEALAILVDHTNYRTINKQTVAVYADIMKKGDWLPSILIFEHNGQLVDGQHRLAAVTECGLSQYFICVYNFPTEAVIALDNGSGRTKGAVAKAELAITQATKKMAITVATMNPSGCGIKITNLQAIDFYREHQLAIDEICDVQQRPLNAAIHASAFVRAIIVHPHQADNVVDAMRKLCEMDFSEPRMATLKLYYRWFVGGGYASGTKNRYIAYKKCARAVQAYLNNKTMKSLRVPEEDPFPIKEK